MARNNSNSTFFYELFMQRYIDEDENLSKVRRQKRKRDKLSKIRRKKRNKKEEEQPS